MADSKRDSEGEMHSTRTALPRMRNVKVLQKCMQKQSQTPKGDSNACTRSNIDILGLSLSPQLWHVKVVGSQIKETQEDTAAVHATVMVGHWPVSFKLDTGASCKVIFHGDFDPIIPIKQCK